jgi:hypothetical protein
LSQEDDLRAPSRAAGEGLDRTNSAGCVNIYRLGRGGLAVLAPDSSSDHETLHTYSLPGIVMRVRNALLSA